jgi:hypothetical protein
MQIREKGFVKDRFAKICLFPFFVLLYSIENGMERVKD